LNKEDKLMMPQIWLNLGSFDHSWPRWKWLINKR